VESEEMTVQYIIIGIVLAASLCYAVYRIREAVRRANNHCYSCVGCPLSPQQRKKKTAGRRKPECFEKSKKS